MDEALSGVDIGKLLRQGIAEVNEHVIGPIKKKTFPQGGTITAAAAEPFLVSCIDETATYIASHAAFYTVGRWMWYLRHLPPQVFDFVGHGEGVRARHLAESLASLYGASDEVDKTQFRVNQATIKRIVRFAGMAFHLDSITGHLQWRGTDVNFRFSTSPLPDPQPTEDIKKAADEYVRRSDAEGLAFAGTGSFVPVSGTTTGEVGLLLAFERETAVEVNVKSYLLRPRDLPMLSYYDAARVSARPAIAMLSHESIGDAPLLPGFYASLCVVALGLMAFHASEGVAEHVLEHGYLVLDRASAELLCRDGLPILNAECLSLPKDVQRATSLADLSSVVKTARAELRRLRPGPLLVAAGDRVLFDIASATQRLFIDAEYPARVDPGRERYRSEAFELAAQKEIDSTGWAPPQAIRELRGRELRLKGLAITDVDAVAARDRTLLLISCKSIPFSGDIDIGKRRIVRNVASKIADYESEWRATIEHIRVNPRGDNYDFTAFSRIEGILVTPHIFYVEGKQLWREVFPGLRAYSSQSELSEWLQSNS